MPISVEQRRHGLALLMGSGDGGLSPALRFGLGAGLYFEYFRRPHESPSHFCIGFNRHLDSQLATRIAGYTGGDARQVVRDALGENALLFNLDRAPTTALMGMEMLAEQLAEFEAIPDWQVCVSDVITEISTTGSCYRRVYLDFLSEIQTVVGTESLRRELAEIASEWDGLGWQLKQALCEPSQLEQASRLLRRLAFREEHFWGNVLAI